MNSRLAEAVIATFREEGPEVHRNRLAMFRAQDWKPSLHWLDASGLALYFLKRAKLLAIEDAVPRDVLESLEVKLQNNRRRTTELLDEFFKINKLFEQAGLTYANLKGFTLVPSYCPDLSYRYQIDLDFLMLRADAKHCREILTGLGYVVTGVGDNVMELKAGLEEVPSFGDLYNPKPQRSVEVHFTPADPTSGVQDCLERVRPFTLHGLTVPALAVEDMFLAQARHLSHHIRSEWTRTSWFLEYKTFVASRRTDAALWREVRARALDRLEVKLAVGMATGLAESAFGGFAPRELTEWSVDSLPKPVSLWLEHYGKHVLLTDFPGSKFYLLLENELAGNREAWRKARRSKLLPLRRPGRVVTPSPNRNPRLSAGVSQLRFFAFRARFHVVEGLRYLREARLWKHLVDEAMKPNEACRKGKACAETLTR